MECLLARLRLSPDDLEAWNHVIEWVRPSIHGWCRQWGLQEADAQDVTQDVLVRLSRRLRTFCLDPSRSFGGWLRTVTRNAWRDFLAARPPDLPGGNVEAVLKKVEVRPDRDVRVSETFDLERFAVACGSVRLRVQPRTWKAFCLTALEELSGNEVAARLGIQISAVFKARSRVQEMLRQELDKFQENAASGFSRAEGKW